MSRQFGQFQGIGKNRVNVPTVLYGYCQPKLAVSIEFFRWIFEKTTTYRRFVLLSKRAALLWQHPWQIQWIVPVAKVVIPMEDHQCLYSRRRGPSL